MDGFSPDAAASSSSARRTGPTTLDPALLRPGRFDRAIGLELPDEAGRAAILAVHARGKPLAPGHRPRRDRARATVGMTGADLASVVNEAALLAARAARATSIAARGLESALTRVLEAPERQRRLSMRDRLDRPAVARTASA